MEKKNRFAIPNYKPYYKADYAWVQCLRTLGRTDAVNDIIRALKPRDRLRFFPLWRDPTASPSRPPLLPNNARGARKSPPGTTPQFKGSAPR